MEESRAEQQSTSQPLARAAVSATVRPLRLLGCSGSLDGGGSERQLWQLVSQLDRARFQPEVFLLNRRGPYLDQLPSDVAVHAFDDHSPAPPAWPPGRISWMQARHLRRLIQSRGIEIVYDRTFHMTLLTAWAVPASVPRVSVIVSPPSRDFTGSERRFTWIKRRLLARAYAMAAVTLCVSQEVAEDAARFYGLPAERLTVLANPVDTQFVRARTHEQLPASAHALLGRRAEQIHAVVVGRFTAEKGHAFVLEVARQLKQSGPELHLHFVGDGPLRSELQSTIERYGLSDRVHQYGYQTNPYAFMARSQLVIVPSRYEGFPNVALEALALGVPLLMTDYGPTAQYLAGANQQRAALLRIDDVEQAAAAVIDCYAHPDAWSARSTVGRSWVEREHALAPWLEQMMSLMERLKR